MSDEGPAHPDATRWLADGDPGHRPGEAGRGAGPEPDRDGGPNGRPVPDGPARTELERLRSLCALLPEAVEIDGLGLPTFRVAARSFAVYEVVAGAPTVCVKLAPEHQAAVVGRPGIRPEPDTGHHGWTVVELGGPVPWDEVDELVVASYRLVAPADHVARLDARLAGG